MIDGRVAGVAVLVSLGRCQVRGRVNVGHATCWSGQAVSTEGGQDSLLVGEGWHADGRALPHLSCGMGTTSPYDSLPLDIGSSHPHQI